MTYASHLHRARSQSDPATKPTKISPSTRQWQADQSAAVTRLRALQTLANGAYPLQRKKVPEATVQGAIGDTANGHTVATTDAGDTGVLFEETIGLPTGHNYTVNAASTGEGATPSSEKAKAAAEILAKAGGTFGKDKLLSAKGLRDTLRGSWARIGKKKFKPGTSKEIMATQVAADIAKTNTAFKLALEAYLKSDAMVTEDFKPNQHVNQVCFRMTEAPPIQVGEDAQAQPAALSLPDKETFTPTTFLNTILLNNPEVAKTDPAIINLTLTDSAGGTMTQRVQFGFEWNTYITRVSESNGTALNYTGKIYSPVDNGDHGASDYSRSHHSDEGAGAIADQANNVPEEQTIKAPLAVDAITKISAEGARWQLVRNNASALRNETKIYTPTAAGKFRYVTFVDLWQSWSKPFDQAFDISDGTVASKLKTVPNWGSKAQISVNEVNSEDAVTGPKIQVT